MFQKIFKYSINVSSTFIKNKLPNFSFNVNSYLFYCSEQLYERKYDSKENNFSHQVLEDLPAYKMTIFKPAEMTAQLSVLVPNSVGSLEELPINELSSVFETNIHLNHQMSDDILKLLNVVKLRCHEMDNEQLASLLRNLKTSNIFEYCKNDELSSLWKAVDKVCCDRWKTWTSSQVFYFIDLWYALNLLKRSDFVFYATLKFLRRPKRLSSQQVVQLLFYLNIMRNTTKNVSLFELECRLEECIQELSIEEIGVAAMGFFKTENTIKNDKILNYIISKTIDNIKNVPEITLASILKMLRHSLRIPLWGRIPEILDVAEQELPRLTIQCSVHIPLLSTRSQCLHESVLRKVSQKLVDNIATCRLKDMEKAVFPLAQQNYNPETQPCIYHSILVELNKEERKDEIMKFPKTFIALVHYLCLKGTYPMHLIEKVLDMDFIHHAYGKNMFMFGREVLYIDTSVELECPSYLGPRLPMNIRNYLSKRYSEYIPDPGRKKLSYHQTCHIEVKDVAELTFGTNNVVEKHLLPNHPRADIVVNLNQEKMPIPLDSSFKDSKPYTGPLKAPTEGNYHAIVVGSKNMYLFKSSQPNGETVSKLKQLKLLGYSPVLVNYQEWPTTDTMGKLKHLQAIIASLENS